MFKKKRYKRQTIGKLQLFFQKDSYMGFNNFLKITKSSSIIQVIPNLELKSFIHFNNVTKKKIHNPNNKVC